EPATASSTAAVSRTERATTCSIESPPQPSPASGPRDVRPRDGFKPTSPHSLDGIRIEPPPSLACATGTNPAATAAAEPPLAPPGERPVSHGVAGGPQATGAGRGARFGACLLEALRDDGIQLRVQALDARDGHVDQLARAHLALPHQLGLRRGIEEGQVVAHAATVCQATCGSLGVRPGNHGERG